MPERVARSEPADDHGLEYALLGLLRQGSMHAYEMYQQLGRPDALGRVWRLKQSHLYALLAKLEAAGYLAATTEPQGSRPPRRVLHLTGEGTARFTRWMTLPVEHGREFRLDFLAKLYFAAHDGPETVAALIGKQRAACAAWLEAIYAQETTAETAGRPFDRLVLRFRASQLEAILGWLDECEVELNQPAASP